MEQKHILAFRRIEALPASFLSLSAAVQFALWFIIVFALKISSLFEPPVWDSAMGVFPAAIFLYESNFDIHNLLQQGNWWQGGPNVHSLSLFTWFAAGVMALTDSSVATFVIIRLTTFGIFAWSLVLFTRVLSDYGLSPRVVIAAACFLTLMPLILVQVGYLYTETWVLALGIAAWTQWHQRRPKMAVLLCIVAFLVKSTALAMMFCVGLVLMLGIRPLSLKKALLLVALPATYYASRALPAWLGATRAPIGTGGNSEAFFDALLQRLVAIPDVTVIATLGTLYGGILALQFLLQKPDYASLAQSDPHAGSRLIALVMPVVFVSGVLAMTFKGLLFLPRYIIPMLPFALSAILLRTHALRLERAAFLTLCAGCLLFAFNSSGRLYEPDFSSFSIVERSHAYRKFHRVQTEVIKAWAAMPRRLPTFVSKEIHYMVSNPLMGYVDRSFSELYPIFLPPYDSRSLADFPDEFVLLYTNRWHGGKNIARLVREARHDPNVEVNAQFFERGGFRSALYVICQRDFCQADSSN